jgi:hypothetical protein
LISFGKTVIIISPHRDQSTLTKRSSWFQR